MRFVGCMLVMLMLINGLGRAANGWQEFAVRPTPDDQERPDIWGTTVVWHQFIAQYGDYDICITDVNEAAEPFFLIIGDANDQINPAIYDNLAVWQDFVVLGGPGDWDIRAVDISDRGDPQLYAVTAWIDNNEQEPAIHGNIVVWQDGPETDLNVYGAEITDLASPLEFPIAAFEHNQQRPAVYRTTVVWEDAYYGDLDIFGADIWQKNKPTDFAAASLEQDQWNPSISSNIVVWEDNFFGDWDIYAADLSTSLKAGISQPDNPVEFAVAATGASQTDPDIDENIVVWQDNRHGNWDIFGYNLTTRREFQITDDRNDQTRPAISGNVVVWQDNRDGHPQIYAVVLDGPAIAFCTSDIPGDINSDCKVDFADFTLMASHWLECNLEPQEACLSSMGVPPMTPGSVPGQPQRRIVNN
ncbi:MAG: hypothetical protein A2Z25_12460 [Planctomycetes bacterium RBG_16_55_9]|nr:MAG: hypothetical protein A2Z25_12460 [Planctomycetes bacterium RBG_16_55_9]